MASREKNNHPITRTFAYRLRLACGALALAFYFPRLNRLADANIQVLQTLRRVIRRHHRVGRWRALNRVATPICQYFHLYRRLPMFAGQSTYQYLERIQAVREQMLIGSENSAGTRTRLPNSNDNKARAAQRELVPIVFQQCFDFPLEQRAIDYLSCYSDHREMMMDFLNRCDKISETGMLSARGVFVAALEDMCEILRARPVDRTPEEFPPRDEFKKPYLTKERRGFQPLTEMTKMYDPSATLKKRMYEIGIPESIRNRMDHHLDTQLRSVPAIAGFGDILSYETHALSCVALLKMTSLLPETGIEPDIIRALESALHSLETNLKRAID